MGLVLGARLGEGRFYNLDRLKDDPAWLTRLCAGGLSGHGAVGCLLAASLYARRALSRLDVTDRIALAGGAVAIVHRLGTLLASFSGRFAVDSFQELLGRPSSLLNTSQWLSLPLIVAGWVVLRRSRRRPSPAGFQIPEETPEDAPHEDDAPSSVT